MTQLPDLINLKPRLDVDHEAVFELLDLAFLGRDTGGSLEQHLVRRPTSEVWNPDLFAHDLFLDNLLRNHFQLSFDGVDYPINRGFLRSILTDPPTDVETVRFRQEILAELADDADLRERVERLYKGLVQLISMLRAPDHVARLDINAHRLEIFVQLKWAVDWMAEEFGDAKSGWQRLAEAGRAIQKTEPYEIVASLIDYERRFVSLNVNMSLGPDARVRELSVQRVEENTGNRFYMSPFKRLLTRFRMFFGHGMLLSNREMVNSLLHNIFIKVAPALVPLVALSGQLEFYLAALAFRKRVEGIGLAVSFAEINEDGKPFRAEKAFNPLLMGQSIVPVPTNIERSTAQGVTLLTGPNSGGKTRLLQTLGLTQILGQAGIYTPAAKAEIPLLHGMFVSLIETEAVDHAEGRLGREMMRIRSLFEGLGTPSMVILDELCSGTNPSEGTELFSLVLELLERLGAVAFISTHFLDYAQGLEKDHPFPGLEFLQVEINEEQRSTYQFKPGVATTSLASVTAERLGVTFDQLSELIDRRIDPAENDAKV